jgi:hypothetical protein
MPPKPRSRPTGDVEEALDQPAKKYKFLPTKKSYDTLELFYQAVVDAKNRGKAPYWGFVDVIRDDNVENVLLRCKPQIFRTLRLRGADALLK